MSSDKDDQIKIYITTNIKDVEFKFLFLSGNIKNNKFYDSYSYYGSSSRLGKEFEIYNESGYKKIGLEILKENNLLFNEKIDFNKLAIENYIENNEKFKSKNDSSIYDNYDKELNEIINNQHCVINSFSKFNIKRDNIEIQLGFRDLHRFNNIVELCSLSLILY